MKVLGVIPARGGSKSIPLKNIKLLGGKPLIYYTIKSAQTSGVFNKLVVSSDSEEILSVARRFDVEVIKRPTEFATDTSRTEEALIHAIEYLKVKESFSPDIVVTIEPTAPFRSVQTIQKTIQAFSDSKIDSAMAVLETRSCYGKIIDGAFDYLIKNQPRRRQEREPLYQESGTIYATRRDTLLEKKSVLGNRIAPIIVPEIEAVDINESIDFELAEFYMERLK